jgi:uncharacterized protein YndB with AHSA1/START domain
MESRQRSEPAAGRQVLRLERELDHPPERVWEAITSPEQLSRWYPFAVVEIDLQIGGRISFDDGDGTIYHGEIRELDPPRVISFTEADDLLHLELLPRDAGCVIVLRHTFDDPSISESNEIGWRECLDDLESLLA